MKATKRILAALLAAAVMIPMVACGEKTEKNPSSNAETTSEVTSTSEEEPVGDLSTCFPDPANPVTLKMFADISWLDYDSMDGGIVAEELKKLTGISIDFTTSTDSEQLNLMIASNELQDLICTYNTTAREQLSDERVCWPLKELQEKYTPAWTLPEAKQKLYALESDDGKYYALYNYYNTVEELETAKGYANNVGNFHVRQDIYEAIGSPAVKNKDDFFALLQTVKEKYPDMQPLVLSHRNKSALNSLVGYDAGKPVDESGNYVYPLSDPKYKDYFKVTNDLYRKGYISEENFSFNSDEQDMQGIGAGTTFMFSYFNCNDEVSTLTPMVQANFPDAKFEQLPLLDTFVRTSSTYLDNGIFIPKTCSNPEAAIKFLCWASQPDGMYTLQYGVKGTDWDFDANGELVVMDRFLEKYNAGTAETEYKSYAYIFGVGDYIFDNKFYYALATPQTKAIFDDTLTKIKWDNVLSYVYPKRDTDERELRTDLNELVTDYSPKLYTAKTDEEFETLWTDMMKEADNIGLADYNAWLQAEYATQAEIYG